LPEADVVSDVVATLLDLQRGGFLVDPPES